MMSTSSFCRNALSMPPSFKQCPMPRVSSVHATTSIMDMIPPLLSRVSRSATPVSMEKPMPAESMSLISSTWSPCVKAPMIIASRELESMAITGGTLNSASTSTNIGTMNSIGVMLKLASRPPIISSTIPISALCVSTFRLRTVYSTKDIISEGVTVYIMEPMCLYTVVPETAGARLVVSEKGDILSPNMAPESTMPPTRPRFMPRPVPIPMNATPRVARVE